MSRFLMIDVGAGTMDILYYDKVSNHTYKAVVKSPVQSVAEEAETLTGDIIITGCEMGGGPITRVLRRHAKEREVIMSLSSAQTLSHDIDKIQSWGIRVITDLEAEKLVEAGRHSHLNLQDIEAERIRRIIEGFGVPFSFDVVAVCAQDHGTPPVGVSHLDFRHNMFTERLDMTPLPHALLYAGDEVPVTMNRLDSLAQSATLLPTKEVYVMDSGMAAVVGASMDSQARAEQRVLILDVATSHTLGAAMEGDEIAGFFEYHTVDITAEILDSLIRDLVDGRLKHQEVLTMGGHGAYIRRAIGFDKNQVVIATGPKRGLVVGSRLPMLFGAPWGDNMMTGTVGLLEAVRRRKGLQPIDYS
ncbi:MAG: DUF1786 family protein [Thermodesulfobacteriota bacterium]|nr:DUF1786 family protein [Thermodesulfobacteriota bacterium]